MDYLPIFMSVRDRRVVVIGGGAVAARKAELLLSCGARVRIVAPLLERSARELLAAAHVEYLAATFSPAHLEGAVLALAATDSTAVNAAVAAAAGERNVPVNVVDDAAHSTFTLPAIVDRSPVIVAVGTEGAAPVLARRLREQLEALLPARLGVLARFAGRRRSAVQHALPRAQRRRFWEQLFGGPIGARVLEGDEPGAAQAFERELAAFRAPGHSPAGEVYLIGAGPGDPDLLTLRALQLLQQADVILYDRLVSTAVLERARREAQRIFVGKDAQQLGVSQERIHELLIEHAQRGLRVARLKGGDPFIFGRGGEEIEALAARGIPVTVVPGITAGIGAAAATGMALTHRHLAQSVTFAAGHFADHGTLDWEALARPRQTVVFYMGVAQLENIVAALLTAGAPAERPAAVIERATLPEQRVLRASLGEIAARARAAQIGAPALLIVGEVAAAAEHAALQSMTAAALEGVA